MKANRLAPVLDQLQT